MNKIAFIGAGNMGGALIKGVCKAVAPEKVVIFDPCAEKCQSLAEKCGCGVSATMEEAALGAEYVVLCVKPQVLPEVEGQLALLFSSDAKDASAKKLISIAAGITLESLAEPIKKAGISVPIVRMLPNTPSEIGEGLIIYSENELADEKICRETEEIFARCGCVEKVTEHILEAASAISGCTPAFAYMFIDALADGAVRCGVPRDKAIRYAAAAVKGSAAMVLETGKHPDSLKDEVCSPGGSTIVGVAKLEEKAFRSAAADAVFFANEKNYELGK